MQRLAHLILVALLTAGTGACGDDDGGSTPDATAARDGSMRDAGTNPSVDSGAGVDGSQFGDAAHTDAAQTEDAAASDAGPGGGALREDFSGNQNLLSGNYPGWTVLHPDRADVIDVGETVPGSLTVVPTALSQNSWFQDQYGPLVYRSITGNFVAVTRLRVVNRNNPSVRPSRGFNAGGFVLRDPSGTHSANENWVMYNMGGQGPSGVNYAREIKKTVDVGASTVSNLFLNAQSETDIDGFLKVCRVGDRFRFYHWSDAQSTWLEERYYNGVTVDGVLVVTDPNSTSVTPEIGSVPPAAGTSVPMFFDHSGMPSTIQLGLMAGSWGGSLDARAEFDFVYVDDVSPASAAGCEAAFADPTAL